MHPNSQRNPHQREAETSKRKCNLPMNLDTNRTRRICALLLQFALGHPDLLRRQFLQRCANPPLHIAQLITEFAEGHVSYLRASLAPLLLSHIYRSEEHTSELQSLRHLVCRLLLEKKNKQTAIPTLTAFP